MELMNYLETTIQNGSYLEIINVVFQNDYDNFIIIIYYYINIINNL